MFTIFDQVYYKDKSMVEKIEKIWDVIIRRPRHTGFTFWEDDPELRHINKIMREVPKGHVRQ